jgi:hypothetical protein
LRIRIKSGQWIRIRIQEDSFSFQQIQLMVEKMEFCKVQSSFFSLSGRVRIRIQELGKVAAASRFLAGLRIRIRIQEGKMAHNSRKK